MKHPPALLLILALGLAACATPAAAPAPPQLDLGNGFTVTPKGDWTLLPDGLDGGRSRGEWLTRYGTELDFVWVVEGLSPGQRAIEASAYTYDGPEWHADLGPDTFIAGSLSALGYYDVSIGAGSPVTAGNWAGSSATWTGRSNQDVDVSGAAHWRLQGDRLTFVITMAADPVYKARVEADQAATVATLNMP
ncbi:MAG: hypothetical protein AAF638_14220 [Pseudomonadota bacterium]